MAPKLSEQIGLILRHGSFFVAIASATIALMSLFLTIDAAKTDREYKELLLRPSLVLANNDASDISVSLENAGLGPAQINEVWTDFFSDCKKFVRGSDPNSLSPEEDKLGYYFLAVLMQPLIPSGLDKKITPIFTVSIPRPGRIIPSGVKKFLFSIRHEDAESIDKALRSLGNGQENATHSEFMSKVFSLPVHFRFCSITGAFCSEKAPPECKEK